MNFLLKKYRDLDKKCKEKEGLRWLKTSMQPENWNKSSVKTKKWKTECKEEKAILISSEAKISSWQENTNNLKMSSTKWVDWVM